VSKVALITGITGQDGSYLADFLLSKDYIVHGIKRKSSLLNTDRVDHIYKENYESDSKFHLHYGDLLDSSSILSLVREVRPEEIYNLGAQSHVAVSFSMAEYTSEVDALGPLRFLEAIRILGLEKKTKFYQASSSELFGKVQETPQNESTPFYPRSPYAVAKLYAYWATINYREAYGIYACNGILFNHESPRRGETFVTRKITRGLSNIAYGMDSCIYLGNLDAKRDWGHARDFVKAQWMMLQQDIPRDYVVATGIQASVKDFVILSASKLGVELDFIGKGLEEHAKVISVNKNISPSINIGDIIVRVSPRYFRPTEVDSLLGDASRALNDLGWRAEISLDQLCQEMIDYDINIAKKKSLLKNSGF
jgi:GDPmannose 4,6-dehydratase